MLLTDSHAIREVVLFPLLRKESTGSEHDEASDASANPGSSQPNDGAKK
jgi:hypothetical protein